MPNELVNSREAELIVDRAFKGMRNLMTPDRIGCYMSKHYAIELSEGTGIQREPIFGVTVVSREAGENMHELSSMFHSRSEAESYITGLKNK